MMLWTQNAWAHGDNRAAAYQCPNGHVLDPGTTRQCPRCGSHDTNAPHGGAARSSATAAATIHDRRMRRVRLTGGGQPETTGTIRSQVRLKPDTTGVASGESVFR